jgi:hypothetical protein
MSNRKYADLAHLSPAEYRVESERRRALERRGYFQAKYIAKKDHASLEETKKRLDETIAAVNSRLAELGGVAADKKYSALE